MKRIVCALTLLLLTATSLLAGGKECEMKQHAAKSVELTGTLVPGSGEHAKAVFRVADSDKSYTVCEKTKDAVLRLGNDGRDTLRVKAKIVHCGKDGGEEILIESARKI